MTAPVTSAGRAGAGGPGVDARRPPSPWRVVVLVLAAVAAALLGVAFSGAALPDPAPRPRCGRPLGAARHGGAHRARRVGDARCARPRRVRAAAPRRGRVHPRGPRRRSARPTGGPTRAARSWPGSPPAPGRSCRSCTSCSRTRASPAGRSTRPTFGAELGVFVTQIDLGPHPAADHDRRGRRHRARARRRDAHRRGVDRGARAGRALAAGAARARRRGLRARHRDVVDGGPPGRRGDLDRRARGARPAGPAGRHRPVRVGRAVLGHRRLVLRRRRACPGWSTACCGPTAGPT